MTNWHELAEDLKTDNILTDLTDSQVESIILVLQALIHADDRVSFTETMELDHMLMELPWSPDKASKLDSLREHAAERVKCATATDTLLREAADDLPGSALREKVFLMAAILGHADGDLGAEESTMMTSLAKHFGLSEAQATTLLAQA